MNQDDVLTGLEALREKFPPEAIDKLPRLTCKDCSNRRCEQHQPQRCKVCGAYISPAHIHLDAVGHANTTDRLLRVDPTWTWEPFALDERGLPALVYDGQGRPVGLWIKLTILGVTRPGYGSVEPGKFDAVKELIGDAIRNAAMRFGVALELWAKTDLESELRTADAATGSAGEVAASPASASSEPSAPQRSSHLPGADGSEPTVGGEGSDKSGRAASTPDGPDPTDQRQRLLSLFDQALEAKLVRVSDVIRAATPLALEARVKPPGKGADLDQMPVAVLAGAAEKLRLEERVPA